MLQTVTASNYQALPAGCVKQAPKTTNRIRARQDVAKRSTSNLATLFPEAVIKSSDVIGWQNLRAVHFRHSYKELVIPASDDHCIVLNLGPTLFTNVYPGKRRFEGRVLSGEVAIIPSGSAWVCRSEDSQLQTMCSYTCGRCSCVPQSPALISQTTRSRSVHKSASRTAHLPRRDVAVA